MSKGDDQRLRLRALITETLPYEVPLIFSNDRLFMCLLNTKWSADEEKLLELLLPRNRSFTRPYSYKIGKDRGGKTTLSIAHPSVQIRMSEFYYNYAHTIIQYSEKSTFSLRHPLTVAPVYSDSELSGEKTFKLGLPHVDPDEGELDVSHIVSFFKYQYNLLSKFFDSHEYISLEKRFSRMRTLDVAKCFFNIYTHSITWAVKGKEFSKRNKDYKSFESDFDDLMQRSNYNETNGIIVGPEISRIFAEIIFQEIDERTRRRLDQIARVRAYEIRRYVDDYFIFAGSDDELDAIEEVLAEELEGFKLFINTDKRDTVSRPFVSKLSLARRNIRESISQLGRLIPDTPVQLAATDMRRHARDIRRRISDLRLVVAEYEIGFHEISGWIFSSLRSTFSRVAALSRLPDIGQDALDALTEVAAAILRLAFYVFSLDVRVRTTYSICQMMISLDGFSERNGGANKEYLYQISFEELHEQIISYAGKNSIFDLNNNVEIDNIFLILSNYMGDYFKRTEVFSQMVSQTISDDISYFGYVTAKFCIMRCGDNTELLERLDECIERKLTSGDTNVNEDCETYLMMIDFLSSPSVSRRSKRRVLETCLGYKKATNAVIDSVLPNLSFVDWNGAAIEHLLQRKQLRSVYSWS